MNNNLTHLRTNDILQLKDIVDVYGVAILTDYFGDHYADDLFASTKKWLIDLNIGLTNDLATWKTANMPLGPRYGMYQSIVSHCPDFWKLREDMAPIFSVLYGTTELMSSIDGASFYPGLGAPRNVKNSDWAHIDQTVSSDLLCYQGQFVATDTSASFVATPGSSLRHADVLRKCGIPKDAGNWHKFTDTEVNKLISMFGDDYQLPILAPKGSVIIWDSRTIHSARYPDLGENSWRASFYVSMRPINTFSQRNMDTIKRAALEGRTTNHWGTKLFGTGDRYKQKNARVMQLVKNPTILSYVENMTAIQKQLVGLE